VSRAMLGRHSRAAEEPGFNTGVKCMTFGVTAPGPVEGLKGPGDPLIRPAARVLSMVLTPFSELAMAVMKQSLPADRILSPATQRQHADTSRLAVVASVHPCHPSCQ
jgi:hypothetical protein